MLKTYKVCPCRDDELMSNEINSFYIIVWLRSQWGRTCVVIASDSNPVDNAKFYSITLIMTNLAFTPNEKDVYVVYRSYVMASLLLWLIEGWLTSHCIQAPVQFTWQYILCAVIAKWQSRIWLESQFVRLCIQLIQLSIINIGLGLYIMP